MSEPFGRRMRPRTLDEYVGQKKFIWARGAVLRNMIDEGVFRRLSFGDPPGVGKTTLAQIIANRLETPFC